MLFDKCNKYIIFTICFLLTFVHSTISSLLIWDSPERFMRNIIHIPWGFTGLFICKFNINYGFIYFIMICLYQIMEQIEHLYIKSSDRSWYDMEGYILGFSYGVLYLNILSYKQNIHEHRFISQNNLDNLNNL